MPNELLLRVRDKLRKIRDALENAEVGYRQQELDETYAMLGELPHTVITFIMDENLQ